MTAVQQCGTVNEQKNSGLIPREWLAVSRLRNGPLTAVHNNGRPEHFGDARQPSAMQKNSVARSLATREKKKNRQTFRQRTRPRRRMRHTLRAPPIHVPLNITRLHRREALLLSVFYCVYRPGRLAASNLIKTAVNCFSGKFKKIGAKIQIIRRRFNQIE